jgi:hypothetical protein
MISKAFVFSEINTNSAGYLTGYLVARRQQMVASA